LLGLTALLLLVQAGTAQAVSVGSLDPTFSHDGIAQTSLFSSEDEVSVQIDSSNRILVAGYDANKPGGLILRYKANGTLDSSWGKRYFSSGYGRIIGLGLFGTKVVVGFSEGHVIRLTSAGKLDLAFGTGGVVSNGALLGATDLGVDANGQAFVAASSRNFGAHLVRISPNGRSVHATTICLGGAGACGSPTALTVSPSFVYVTGVAPIPGSEEGFDSAVIGRFSLNGSLDTTYGLDGYAWRDDLETRTGSWPYDVAVSPTTGQVVVVGDEFDLSGDSRDSFYTRFTADGFIDPTFDGYAWFGDCECDIYTSSRATSVTMQSGKVVIAGLDNYCNGGYRQCFGIERLTPDGNLDTSFAGVGFTHSQGAAAGVTDIKIFNQKIVLVGGQYVARYQG